MHKLNYGRSFFLILILVITSNANPTKRRENKKKTKSNVARGMNPKDMDIDQFLEKFGYLAPLPEGVPARDAGDRIRAIKNFQKMAHLKQTGRMDAATSSMMKKPRCGMVDMDPGQAAPSSNTAYDQPQNFAVHDGRYKWEKPTVTWKARNYSPDLDSGSQRRALYNAFKKWSEVVPLDFVEIGGGKADIDIEFAPGVHSDGPGNAFDGNGGVLAHAFAPDNGDVHFDEDEQWTQYTHEGTNLEIVAAHEIGHSIGLLHSEVPGALMAPYFQGYDPNYQLHEDDIAGAQFLYGNRLQRPSSTESTTTPRPQPTQPSTERETPSPTPALPHPDTCSVKFDAMLMAHDNRIYVFRGEWLWRLNDWEVERGSPVLATSIYPQAPSNIGAGVYSWRTQLTYLFKRTRIFVYRGFELVERRTISQSGFPKVMAAFTDRNGCIYLFEGSEYWEFDESTLEVKSRVGRPIASKWPSVPPNIEAAVTLRDGYTYFVKGEKYRKFNPVLKRVESGYPKYKAAPWMGPTCGGRYVPK